MVFNATDVRKTGMVSIRNMFNGFAQVLCPTERHHMQIFFDLYDVDDDSTLDPTEVRALHAGRARATSAC